jgi:integrase
LHFHDLRRECGSRWLDAWMPLHAIRDLLGHADISQTSSYLSTTTALLPHAMARFELQRIATKAKTSGQTKPRSATGRKRKPSKTAVGRDTPVM